MEDEELEEFTSLSDEAGEISKHDLIVQTKKSSFWKGNLDLKNKPSGHSTKVFSIKSEYSTDLFGNRNRNKSSYPYGVDIFGNIVTKKTYFQLLATENVVFWIFTAMRFFFFR